MANIQNLHPQPFTSESAKLAQEKSVSKRKQNQTVREATKSILMQPVTDKEQLDKIEKSGLPVGTSPTYIDLIVSSIIMRSMKRGHMDDLLKLMDILGEEKDITSYESLDKAIEILGTVNSVID